MIDIHSHILPNIDDGSRNINESIEMIRQAEKSGFTSIVCTSHYMSDIYNCDKEKRQMLISELQNEITKNDINIKLYNGAEIYISTDIRMLIDRGIVPTLNNSKYILFELPMNSKVIYLDEVINELLNMNLVPILAHPERYSYMQENYYLYDKLIKKGVLFQGNLGSVIGIYGNRAKKTIKKLLKNNMVHFLAADSHRPNDIYIKMDEVLKKLSKIIKDKDIELLTKINPEHILKNEVI